MRLWKGPAKSFQYYKRGSTGWISIPNASFANTFMVKVYGRNEGGGK